MTTAQSPLWKLKEQARTVARMLKKAERGEGIGPDPDGKIAAARQGDSITFAVAMDDKVLKIEMAWATIRDTPESAIAGFILNQMRDVRATAH